MITMVRHLLRLCPFLWRRPSPTRPREPPPLGHPAGRAVPIRPGAEGITNGRVRPQVAQLLGVPTAQYTARQMGYDLRRLVRKGLLRPVEGKLCYTLTPFGRRVALFLTKLHARVLRPGLQALDLQISAQVPPPLRTAFTALDAATEALIKEARLAA